MSYIMSFLNSSENIAFNVALAIVLLIGVFEIVLLLIGQSLMALDIDFDIDADIDVNASTNFNVFDWLYFGKVPMAMLMVVFLTVFGITGFIIQTIYYSLFDSFINAWIISIPVFLLTIFTSHFVVMPIYKFMPKDETTALSQKDLIGYEAEITIGLSKVGSPAEAKLKDKFGQTHYIMVEPNKNDIEFKEKDKVTVVKHIKDRFYTVSNEV